MLAHYVCSYERANGVRLGRGEVMVELPAFKVTERDGQILKLLLEGCSNKEIACELSISPRTVKQHLRSLFSACRDQQRPQTRKTRDRPVMEGAIPMQPRNHLTPREVQVACLVWEGHTNR